MKKIIGILSAAACAAILMSCASTGGAKKASGPYTIKAGDGVVGYYNFEECEDDTMPDVSGNGMDIFSNGLDGLEIVEGYNGGSAMYFNGEDEYISLDSMVIEGEGCTLAMWVNPTSWKDWARVFDIGNCVEDAWCGMDWNTKMLRMDLIGAAGNCSILSPLPVTNKWTHIAAVFGDGKAALYVNGKLAQKLTCPVTTANLAASVNGVYIGRSNWADPLYCGAMDDLLVANRAFSDEEIAAVYNGVVVEE